MRSIGSWPNGPLGRGRFDADRPRVIGESALAAMRQSLDAATVTANHVATARGRVRPLLEPTQVTWLVADATRQVVG